MHRRTLIIAIRIRFNRKVKHRNGKQHEKNGTVQQSIARNATVRGKRAKEISHDSGVGNRINSHSAERANITQGQRTER